MPTMVPFVDRDERLLTIDNAGSGMIMYQDKLLGVYQPVKNLVPGTLTAAQRIARTDLLTIEGAQIKESDTGFTYEVKNGAWDRSTPDKIQALVSGYGEANRTVIGGDSFSQNNAAGPTTIFVAQQSSGYFTLANALLGQRFSVIGRTAVGGKTAAQMLVEQVPTIKALTPKYCAFTAGFNDLYNGGANGQQAASNVIAVVESLLSAGIVPIWSTVWARPAVAGVTDDHFWCNDILKRYAANNKCGLFWDGFKTSVLPGIGTLGLRSGWTYDGAPAQHPNNLGAYWLAKTCAKAIDAQVPKVFTFASGPEDQTTSVNNKSNILVNPVFAGTAGSVGANATGTMPDSWNVSWATRTGTGSVAASIVDVTDPDTGLAIAKGIQLVLSGTPANGDTLIVTQNTGLTTALSGGDLVSVQGVIDLLNPTFTQQVRLRVQTNGSESAWWGQNSPAVSGGGTYEAYPESAKFYAATDTIAVLGVGAPSAALYEMRITFNGAATGTITLSQPRLRVGALD